jgi:hypothetical protein
MSDTISETDDFMKVELNKKYDYPDPNNEDFQSRIYLKKEFHVHRIPERPQFNTKEEITAYRSKLCDPKIENLKEQQIFLSNFINPNTPYRGVLIYHGVGVGKCVRGDQMVRVNNNIYTMKEVWSTYKTETVQDEDYGIWTKPSHLLYTDSYEDGQIVHKRIVNLYRQYVDEFLVQVKLSNGLQIIMTQKHRLLSDSWTNQFQLGQPITVPLYMTKYTLIDIKHINNYKLISLLYLYGRYRKHYFVDKRFYTILKREIGETNIMLHSNEIELFTEFTQKFVNTYMKHILNSDRKIQVIKWIIELNQIDESTHYQDIYIEDDKKRYQIYCSLLELHYNCEYKGKCVRIYDDTQINHTSKVYVLSMEYIHHKGYVYDMEIEDTHNYIVNGILTHNTCAAIAIAEKFKSLVSKYNTKIHVLVPGPLLKESWKRALIDCTTDTYLQNVSNLEESLQKDKLEKDALQVALQYYRILTYKGFYRRVLGEKIVEKDKKNKKNKYKKNEEGEFERDVSIDKIDDLSNSLIIVDEAHNLTGKDNKQNEYGLALKHIIKNSVNLKIVLLTATPMKNLADDIIDLINFIRPSDQLIERSLAFTSNRNFEVSLTKTGLDYIKKMTRGYISHLRGADPLTFAKRKELGEIPKQLLFTKVIGCTMKPFQSKAYENVNDDEEDHLSRKITAISNFVFPILEDKTNKLVGISGEYGLHYLKEQLNNNHNELNNQLCTYLNVPKSTKMIELTNDQKYITGQFLNSQYLKHFSTKFYKALKNVNDLVYKKKGACTAFIYSNVVKVGIKLFREILLNNGYLEYSETSNYRIYDDTRCYYCGVTYKAHDKTDHNFGPATFFIVTGKTAEDSFDTATDRKQYIIDTIFNHFENVHGKYIKFILGSKVMNEGITLKNVGEVHILDVHYNLGRIEQVIGRAVRYCSHYKRMVTEDTDPVVRIYKYVIDIPEKSSAEIELYRKAELKYLQIHKIERALKEVSIDCALNRNGNIFPEEVEQYKDCEKESGVRCPDVCNYTTCQFLCDDPILNRKYYDKHRNIYKILDKDELDITTFNEKLEIKEIEKVKQIIKKMFLVGFVYTIQDILTYVNSVYTNKLAYDEFFVHKALEDMIPDKDKNFLNFKDIVYDRFSRQCYLIYKNGYYIANPFDMDELVSMEYRVSNVKNIYSELGLYDYLKQTNQMKEISLLTHDNITSVTRYEYDLSYYENRLENDYIGIIDRESDKKSTEQPIDMFKIRSKLKKTNKSRGTGIPTFKGADCKTKPIHEIRKIAKQLKIKLDDANVRDLLCTTIRDELMYLEKYSTGKDKKTYMMIPSNHPVYSFPYNLEDRVEHITSIMKDNFENVKKGNIKIKKLKELSYRIESMYSSSDNLDLLKRYNPIVKNDKIVIIVE